MATEVKHGPHPKFRTPLLPGRQYSVRVEGRYTRRDHMAAGGVTAFVFHGTGIKRLAELLVLRTCFLEWYLAQWVRAKGLRRDGIAQIRQYPFRQEYPSRKKKKNVSWWGRLWTRRYFR